MELGGGLEGGGASLPLEPSAIPDVYVFRMVLYSVKCPNTLRGSRSKRVEKSDGKVWGKCRACKVARERTKSQDE